MKRSTFLVLVFAASACLSIFTGDGMAGNTAEDNTYENSIATEQQYSRDTVHSLLREGESSRHEFPGTQSILGGVIPSGISEAMTVGSLLDAGGMVQRLLHNFTVDFGSETRLVVGGLSEQLSINLTQLGSMVQDTNTTLNNLNFTARNLAVTMANAIDTMNQMIDIQRQCASQDLGVFTATLQTIASRLKQDTLLAKTEQPYARYFMFDREDASKKRPFLVPYNGGRVTISGYRLWSDKDAKPQIVILDQTRKTTLLDNIEALKGGTPDEVLFNIPKEFVSNHAGQCVDIGVTAKTKERKGGLFKKIVEHDLYLPMCMPANYTSSYSVAADTQYKCSSTVQREGKRLGVHVNNEECGETVSIHQTEVVNLDPSCQIISTSLVPGDMDRGTKWANATFTASSITIDGVLGEANCTNVGIIHKKWSHSCFDRIATPILSCKVESTESSARTSDSKKFEGNPELNFVVELDKKCEYDKSDVQYTIFESRPGMLPMAILPGTRETAGMATINLPSKTEANITASGTYTPGVAGKTAQVAIKLKRNTCGY